LIVGGRRRTELCVKSDLEQVTGGTISISETAFRENRLTIDIGLACQCIERDRGNAQRGESVQLATIADAVMVLILPDQQIGKIGVGGIYRQPGEKSIQQWP
jgi:hypothetical protein